MRCAPVTIRLAAIASARTSPSSINCRRRASASWTGCSRRSPCGAPPPAAIGGVISLDRGVAYRVDSPALLAIREAIADWFAGSLSAQDRGVPRLHITVQNKVASAAARALLAELRRDFRARPLAIAGLAAHYYRGGPWETVATRNFRGRS